jgi:hypothetical protein
MIFRQTIIADPPAGVRPARRHSAVGFVEPIEDVHRGETLRCDPWSFRSVSDRSTDYDQCADSIQLGRTSG